MNGLPNDAGDLHRIGAFEAMLRDVQVSFIERNRLHQSCVLVQNRHHTGRNFGISLEPGTEKIPCGHNFLAWKAGIARRTLNTRASYDAVLTTPRPPGSPPTITGLPRNSGTPTEITLSAILQHRKDQVPYGVPNLNGFPINVPRNTAYGYDSDATVQDLMQLNSTIDHKFDTNLSLRNQTEFVWVNTAVHETSGGFVGTLAANGGFVQAAAGPGNTPYIAAPLNQL